MKTYAYKGFGQNGRAQRGIIEANSLKEARERLARSGTLSESILPASASEQKWHTRRRATFSIEARSTVYHELGALFSAGLAVDHALDILIDSPELSTQRNMLAVVRDRVRDGDPLAEALAAESPQVSSFEKSIIEVGERSARLDVVFEELAIFLEQQRNIRERVRNALLYPAFVIGVGTLIAVFMLTTVIPWAAELLDESDRKLPVLTQVLLAIGGWVRQWGILVPVLGLGAWAWIRKRARHDPVFRCSVDRRIFLLPVLGHGYGMLANLRFARTLVILLRAGIPLVEGLTLAGRATGSAWIDSMVVECSEAVRHGSSLEDAVRRVPPLSHSLPGWIRAGEAGGDLPRLLGYAANRYEKQWEGYVTRCLAVFEPILILCVGVFVLIIALSVLLPILSLSQALG